MAQSGTATSKSALSFSSKIAPLDNTVPAACHARPPFLLDTSLAPPSVGRRVWAIFLTSSILYLAG